MPNYMYWKNFKNCRIDPDVGLRKVKFKFRLPLCGFTLLCDYSHYSHSQTYNANV